MPTTSFFADDVENRDNDDDFHHNDDFNLHDNDDDVHDVDVDVDDDDDVHAKMLGSRTVLTTRESPITILAVVMLRTVITMMIVLILTI